MVLSTTIRNLALQVLEQYLPIRLPYTAVLFLVGWGWGSLLSAGELSHASDLVVGIGPGKLISSLSECFAHSTSGHTLNHACSYRLQLLSMRSLASVSSRSSDVTFVVV